VSESLEHALSQRPRQILSTRKIVHMSMLAFALLLPFLTWLQAAGCAVLALFFNLFVLPRLGVDLRKNPKMASAEVPDGRGEAATQPFAGGAVGESVWTGIVIYPVSVLILILLYRHSLYVAAAAWAIMALGDGIASIAGEAFRGPTLPWNQGKTWWGSFAFLTAGTVGAYGFTRWVAPSLPVGKTIGVCILAAMVGALVESLPIRLDDNLSVPLVSGGFMFCAFLVERSALESNLPFLARRAILAAIINLVFAFAAWQVKMVSRSGAVAGFLLGVAVYLGYGTKSFLELMGFFLLGSAATRLGYSAKVARGIAEGRGGARTWREALANGLAAAFFSVLVITTRHETIFLTAMVAALAEAAGDTASSEIGKWLSERAYMITTFKPVAAGEDGAVSFSGSVAGIVASAALVALGFGLGIIGRAGAAIALTAALAGNLLDSVLGATVERAGLVSNGIVNFTSTAFAGGLAIGILLHLGY
jgi:uncharacterized protein (TIGR00297 family)